MRRLATINGTPQKDLMPASSRSRANSGKRVSEAETRFPEFARDLLEAGIKSFCGVPLMVANRRIGVLGLASTQLDAFRQFKLQFMQRTADAANVADNLSAA